MDIENLVSNINSLCDSEGKNSMRRAAELKEPVKAADSICGAISTRLRQISTNINKDATPEQQLGFVLEQMGTLDQALRAEPTNLRMQFARSQADHDTWARANKLVTELIETLHRKEEKVAQLAEKITSGELDPNARRKPGQRPESLKNVRAAQKILKEEP